MRKRPRKISKSAYVKSKERVLSEFGIDITTDITAEIENRYPNEASVESYTRKLIMEHLGED